jgi:limonene 1,2-monooxygenase
MQLAHEWANPMATHRSYELIAQRVIPEFQGQAYSTLNAQTRAVESRPELADRNMKAVEEMVAKHLADLAAG